MTVRQVPYILAAHDCISGIASGMTTKCAAFHNTHSNPPVQRMHEESAAFLAGALQSLAMAAQHDAGLA